MNLETFVPIYLNKLKNLLDQIDSQVITNIVQSMELTLEKKSRIYVIGNGGSSATASHMANDFGVGLRRRKIVNFDIISLADNAAVMTAVANDIGFENSFYMQLEGLLTSDDLLIAISCSGNSPNIVKAVEYAKQVGSTVVGVTGFQGGRLKPHSDINFHVNAPEGEYGLVEDLHMILDHIIYTYYNESSKDA